MQSAVESSVKKIDASRVNNRGPLILIVMVLMAGALAAFYLFGAGSAGPNANPAETAAGNNQSGVSKEPDRSLTNAKAPVKTDSRTAANLNNPPPRNEAGKITVRLRVLDSRGELIQNAFVSSTSQPPPSIERHEVETLIEGQAPININIFADGYFGTRFLEFNETTAADVRITLAKKVSIRLSVKLEGVAGGDAVSGLFVASQGESSSYQFSGIDNLLVDAPEGEGEAGWTNGYYQSEMKKVKFTEGMILDLAAAARPAGIIKINCKEKPSLQFWMDPSGGRVFKKDQMMGGAIATGAEGEWVFERVPAGPARVIFDAGMDGNATIEEITVPAGSTLLLKH